MDSSRSCTDSTHCGGQIQPKTNFKTTPTSSIVCVTPAPCHQGVAYSSSRRITIGTSAVMLRDAKRRPEVLLVRRSDTGE